MNVINFDKITTPKHNGITNNIQRTRKKGKGKRKRREGMTRERK